MTRGRARTAGTVTFHRNGISGEQWYGVTFFDPANAEQVGIDPDSLFLAVVPSSEYERGEPNRAGVEVYVVALDAPEERWRGDTFAEFAFAEIRKFNAAEDARFARLAADAAHRQGR